MSLSEWFGPPRHLLVLFLAVMLVLVAALGWLSWRFVQQDRELESQRIQEHLDYTADLIGAALVRKLSETQEQLTGLLALSESQLAAKASLLVEPAGETALIAVMRPQGVDVYPRTILLYSPILPAARGPAASAFASGEASEFQQKDNAKAIAVFRELAGSRDPAVRAGALLRLARNLRKTGRPAAALTVYDELAQLGPTPIGGVPAELLARHARCVLLDGMKRLPELQHEASALYADLHRGRWQLTRGAYRFYAQEVRRWFTPDPSLQTREQDALALAAGVESLWDDWQRIRQGEGRSTGRHTFRLYDRSLLLVWGSTPERLVALVAGPRFIERHWLAPLRLEEEPQGVRLVLTDVEGHRVAGQFVPAGPKQALRTSAETQLPWTLHVASADPHADLAQLGSRRRLLLAGFAVAVLLVLLGSYFIVRAVTRELEVARLQSNFVSAVSHEFRTPLASLRQLSELLADGRVSSEERRLDYFKGLRRESERLHRLVENLLDFGRMEAGAREYRFELLEAGELVRGVAEEFAQEVRDRGYSLDIVANHDLPRVRADREALSRALWNLFDNAVKYSPVSKTVWVEAACEANHVAIRVRDEGLGIAPNEQQQIFKKFVRAASAEAAGIKGTGLGLAMVEHIVAAHNGEILLESQPGVGSTFTILLPTAL